MTSGGVEQPPPLVPLLEQIYATGQVETEAGDTRPAESDGVPREHALRLAALVREHDLRSTLETGMAFGLSTMAIAGVHSARGAGQHVAIDPAATSRYGGVGLSNLARAGVDAHVRVIEEDSQVTLPRLASEGLRLDFAFIDGQHLFDHTLLDFFFIDRMLETGGYVAFHDTWMPSVQDVVAFVAANRQYERTIEPDGGMAVVRKRGRDRRRWDHYRPFARQRAPSRPAAEEARALFDELLESASEAAERTGGFRRHALTLGEQRLTMSFAGEALEPALLTAFAHAASPPTADDGLKVVLWDEASSGVDDPAIPWSLGDVRARGDVRGYEDEQITAFSEPASGAITVFDRTSRTIVHWVSDARVIPWYERGAPLRAPLHQWAALSGRHFVHAGAVGTGGRGVLLAGPSGSGKSTSCLACLEAGFDYAGDDYVILTAAENFRSHCVYSTAKLDHAGLERLPSLTGAVAGFQPGEESKLVLDLYRHRPDGIRAALPVDAVVVPSVGWDHKAPVVRPATGAEALRALAPTSLLQLPGAAAARLRAMADLARRVPVFSLELGGDVSGIPDAIAEICERAAARQDGAPPG